MSPGVNQNSGSVVYEPTRTPSTSGSLYVHHECDQMVLASPPLTSAPVPEWMTKTVSTHPSPLLS